MAYDRVIRLGCFALCSLVCGGLAQAAPLRLPNALKVEEYYRLDDLIDQESDFQELKATARPLAPAKELPAVDLEPPAKPLTVAPVKEIQPLLSAPVFSSSINTRTLPTVGTVLPLEPLLPPNLILPDLDFSLGTLSAPRTAKDKLTAIEAPKASGHELKRGKRAPVTEKSTKMIPAIPADSDKLVIPPPPAIEKKSEAQAPLVPDALFKTMLSEALVQYNLSPVPMLRSSEPYAIVSPVVLSPSEGPEQSSSWAGRVGKWFEQTGFASWYGQFHHGKKTASGLLFNKNALTAAHPSLPLLSFARVTNLENGQSAVVQITDRGPYRKGRILDVSEAAARLLGFLGQGTASVRIEALAGDSAR